MHGESVPTRQPTKIAFGRRLGSFLNIVIVPMTKSDVI